MLSSLPKAATIYIKDNEPELSVGVANNLRSLAANIKFIGNSIPQNSEKSTPSGKFSFKENNTYSKGHVTALEIILKKRYFLKGNLVFSLIK